MISGRGDIRKKDIEKLKKSVVPSKKKLSKLRRKMKDAKADLAEKEKLVKDTKNCALIWTTGLSLPQTLQKRPKHKESAGYQCKLEADRSKSGNVINMLRRAIKRGFDFEYVLFDSWFFSKEILACIAFHSRCIKLIAMVKMNRTLYRDSLDD